MSDRLLGKPTCRRIYDRPRQTIMTFSESRTKQSPAEACDVNSIMARYTRTGLLPVTRMQGVYADVSALSGVDFGSAMAVVQKVEERFMDLPVHVREYFRNSPQAFFEFVHDPKNRDKAIELGLCKEVKKDEVKTETPTA